CAILLQAMPGHDPRDPASARRDMPDYRAALRPDLRGVRIGIARQFIELAGDEARAGIDAALGLMHALGAELREVRLSPPEDYGACGWIILFAEAWAVHEHVMRRRFMDYGKIARERIVLGAFLSSADYLQAVRLRGELIREMEAAMSDLDVIVTAATPGDAPALDDAPSFASFQRPMTMPFNVTGRPVLATRCGFSEKGLPLSLQIVGKPFEEAMVLRVGHAYERATDWHLRRPALAL
ncbi:MAG: amidase, partial [Alphaproteobacteria bacterium]|nr:amidase [Alphaproteobacteria bacterium]